MKQLSCTFVLALLVVGCTATNADRNSMAGGKARSPQPGVSTTKPDSPPDVETVTRPSQRLVVSPLRDNRGKSKSRNQIQLTAGEKEVASQSPSEIPRRLNSDRSEVVPPAPVPFAGSSVAGPLKESEGSDALPVVPSLPDDEGLISDAQPGKIALDDVISSVYQTYPLLAAALRQRDIADGEVLSAQGGFDLKFSAGSENQPLGFYETYRNNLKLVQPLFSGGDAFAAYRIGRGGLYEPWYLERQTNDAGEFKAGVSVPFLRNRSIDERRSNLWKSTYGREQVDFEIQAELIDFVQHASYAYWEWVAAGERYLIATTVLDLAQQRNAGIARQVELGDKEPPLLKDNRRLIVSREAKQIEALRKLQQTAIKLSLFYRQSDGAPSVPTIEQHPEFPVPGPVSPAQLDSDITAAVDRRPELKALDIYRKQLEVDLAQAGNDYKPAFDGFVAGSQDMGKPTSKKQDKSQFEMEAGIVFEVPVQRRKAQGKMNAVQAKLAQVVAKRQITQDKIVVEVQQTYAALIAARDRVTRARESQQLADQMSAIERRRFELGEADLLSVNLREQQSVEAAETLIDALLEAFRAQADYRAALAWDDIP